MKHYALVEKPRDWMTLVTGVENPIHVQCGEPMRRVPGDSELYSCVRCLSFGYLLEEDTR
jgi:hypothetical protein